jgi:adenosylmethionine-8-amino-7-oxononanoate aminotransferase
MVDFMPMRSFSADPLILTEGDGVRVRDIDGRWYLDGLSGTFCLSLGHGNAAVIEAATRQLSRLVMAAPTMATSDRSLELARMLLTIVPERYTHLKWASGGSEAIEAAIKMTRQFQKQANDPRKFKVLSHYRAYHGVTGQAMAASGWPYLRNAFEPLAGGFVHLHTPDPVRHPFGPGVTPETLGATYAGLVEEVIELEGPETIAAFITEPILMSAGVVVPPRDYLPRIRALCDDHDILLIYDEIITGFGRTGTLFGAELFDAWPDILVVGKGISGGYAPLSATIVTERIAESFWTSDGEDRHFQAGHTFAGTPLACAIGLAAIGEIIGRDLPANARARGDQARQRLRRRLADVGIVGDIRGEGLLIGLELVEDRVSMARIPAAERLGMRIRDVARRNGLLVRASHWFVAMAPPLTTSPDEMDEMVDRLVASVREVLDERDRRRIGA